jgi:hypothetical protein
MLVLLPHFSLDFEFLIKILCQKTIYHLHFFECRQILNVSLTLVQLKKQIAKNTNKEKR